MADVVNRTSMPKNDGILFDGQTVDVPLRNAMVDAFNEALDRKPNMELAMAIAFETGMAIMRSRTSDLTLAEKIASVVAIRHGIDLVRLRSESRATSICQPRFIAWWLIRKHVGMSYPAIGTMFGGFHHATVIKGCQNVEASTFLKAEATAVENILFPAILENGKIG